MSNARKAFMDGNPISLVGEAIKVGDKAPNFTALYEDLQPFTLESLGDKKKVISVVPSLDTGVCELQTVNFSNEAKKLEDTAVITISVDLPFAISRFKQSHEEAAESTIVSDYNRHDFGKKYGFLIDELQLLNRGVVILDKDNTVKYVEYLEENVNHVDYAKALEAVKSL